MPTRIHFTGPIRYRLRLGAALSQSLLEVATRRMLKGPRRRGWNWFVELSTNFLRRQLIIAFNMRDVNEIRAYLDAIVISSPVSSDVEVTNFANERFSGKWVSPMRGDTDVKVLYLHGGGYSFYPRSYEHFIALMTLAANARTFALNYRLTPEHRFPAQLEDATAVYRWLLETGADPENLVVIGDSAGANLAIALLLTVRDSGLPPPALAVAISPPTDFASDYPSVSANEEFDWINKQMLLSWAGWFCDKNERENPLISPLWADLRGLSPIYIQAGRCEILDDSIRAFANRAREQGADVTLESWEDMTHVFQIFGPEAPQSAEALRRIGEVIDARVRKREPLRVEHGLH
ncbi:MAG TPA: alpha/beta hydrolase [Terriglobales bacterium]